MPPIWSGTLTFGLVAIPVRVEPAVHSHRVAFRQIHLEDHGRVRNRRVCELEDDPHPLSMDEIGRAFETPDGTLVPISDRELDDLPLPTAKTVEISGFLDLATIPGEQFGTPYFLSPAVPGGEQALRPDA
jgi:DNA end-binding protein Ku